MKKTEVAPGAESNDFRFGVNGFPKPGGLYRLGDNGAIPPHRLYRGWNIQFNGDEIAERGGQSEFCDTADAIPVTGLFSSNDGWPDEPGISGGSNEVPRLQWGEIVRGSGAGTDSFENKTGYKADSGLFSITGFDPTYAGWASGYAFAEDVIGGGAGHSNGTLVPTTWSDGLASWYLCSTCKHDGKFFVSMFDGVGGAGSVRILYATSKTTSATVYSNDPDHADYTDITDTGLTILDNVTVVAGATQVNCAPYLFSFQGSLYALYRRLKGTPMGLIRKWSGTGTTWSTYGTFPTLTVKDDATESYGAWDMGGSERAYAYWRGALYIPVVQTAGDPAAGGYNDIHCNALSILKFDGTTLTEFYNYAVAAPKRSTGGSGAETAGARRVPYQAAVLTLNVLWRYYYNEVSYSLPFVAQGRLFVPVFGCWYGQALAANEQQPQHCLVFDTDGTLYGDTITTPTLVSVQGSVKPTLPVDTSGYPSTTYPNWNAAPWAFAINVDGVLWGMWQWQLGASNFTRGNNGPVEDDYRAWVYRSIDGFAWYKAFELTTSGTSANLGMIPSGYYMVYVPKPTT